VRCVRVNDLTTEYAYEDIIEVVEGARENLDVIMLPKAMSAADVQFVDKLLTMMEKEARASRNASASTC
jgi:citrate lyase subunit beta/citryl-CoA lyase